MKNTENTEKTSLFNLQISSRKNMSKIALQFILALILMLKLISLSFAQGGTSENTNITMSSNVSSSTPTAGTKGVNPTIGSYGGSNFDKVNLFNGNVSMSFPLASLTSRGGMSVGIVLSYNSKIWHVEKYEEQNANLSDNEKQSTAITFMPAYGEYDDGVYSLGAGWTIHAGRLTARQTVFGKSTTCFFPTSGKPMPKPVRSSTVIVFTAPDGTEYDLRDTIYDGAFKDLLNCEGVSRGNTFVSKDGTSATFVCDTNIQDGLGNDQILNLNGYLYLRDGTRFRIQNGRPVQQRDHNGNIVRYEYNGNQLTKVTDNMGRTITVVYPTSGNILASVTIKGFDGANRVTNVMGGSLSSQVQVLGYADLFPVGVVTSQVFANSFDPGIVTSVVLPDGHQWSFQYNAYGEVIGVITPAKGKVAYEMGPSAQAGGGAGGYNENNNEIFRRVLTRKTYPSDQGTIEGMVSYTDPTDVTRQDADGNVTVTEKELDPNSIDPTTGQPKVITESRHKFSDNPLIGISGRGYRRWREGKELETRILNPDTGNRMRTVVNLYQLRAGVSWAKDLNGNPVDNNYLFQPENDPRVIKVTSTLEDGTPKTSLVDYAYDDFNNVLTEQLTGYNGEIIRKVDRTYLSTQGDFDYTGFNRAKGQAEGDPNLYDTHLRSLIASETIKSVSGNTQTIESQSTYEYDNYSTDAFHAGLMPRTLTVNSHATNYQSSSRTQRGNVTGVTRGLDSRGDQSPDKTSVYSQYDVLGNIVAVVGPFANQRTTTDYSIASQFTFPEATHQSVNSGLTGDRILTSSRTYDFSTGLVISSTGLNGADETTTFEYNDMLDRLTREVRPQTSKISLYPTGFGVTTYTYSAPGVYPNTVMVDTILDNSSPDRKLHSESKFDGFLRTMEQHRTDPGGEVVSQIFYDATGRVSKVTNPFRANDPNATTNGYTTSKYDPLDRVWMIETFDQNGISTGVVSTEYDTNLVTVTDQAGKKRKSETDAAGRLTKVYEPDSNNNLSLETSYSYDARSNLKTVVQGTELPQSTQQRIFTYDALSRLTSASSPESGSTSNGVTTYDYDIASNLKHRTDPRGIVTTYSYDSLNRLTIKSYSDQTPQVKYFYDVNPSSFLPTGVTAPNNFTFQYTLGRATAIASPTTTRDAASGLFHTYDVGGRIAQSSQFLDGQHYTTNSAYNEASLPTSHTYPSGRVTSHTYNIAGQIMSVNSNLAGNQVVSSDLNKYTASGALMSQHLGNGLYHQMDYNSRLQPTSISLGSNVGTSDKWRLDYDYGIYDFASLNAATTTPSISIIQNRNNGNIGNIKLTPGANTSPINQFFVYDELNRLQLAKEFTSPSAPQITSIDPNSGGQGTSFSVTITGSNLTGTQQVVFSPADGLTVSNITSSSDTVTALVTIANDATISERSVKVVTNGIDSNSLTFSVTENFNCGGTYSFIASTGDMNYDNSSTDGDTAGVSALSFDSNSVTSMGTATFDLDLTDPNLSSDTTIFANWLLTVGTNRNTSGTVTLKFSVGGQLIATKTLTATTDAQGQVISNGQPGFGGYFLNPDIDTKIRASLAPYLGSHAIATLEVTATATGAPGFQARASGGIGFPAITITCGSFIPRFRPQAWSRHFNKGKKLSSGLTSPSLYNLINPTPSWSQAYSYDRFGNRLAVVGTNAQSLNILAAKNRIADAGYQYDLAGNLIADPSGKYYRYDAENRLVTAASDTQFTNIIAQYFYDGNGWRIKKSATNGTTTRFVYDQGGRLLEEFDGEPVPANNTPTREHIYGASGMLATVEPDKINYHTPDHLGSPRVLTDATGAIISRRDFFPFGESMPDSIGGRTTIAGYSIPDSIKQKFTGYQRDDETGLDFAHARYFASSLGRFTSVDPLGRSAHLTNPQTWNRYSYVLNNPINYNDPQGLQNPPAATAEVLLSGGGAALTAPEVALSAAAALPEAGLGVAVILTVYVYANEPDIVNKYAQSFLGMDEFGVRLTRAEAQILYNQANDATEDANKAAQTQPQAAPTTGGTSTSSIPPDDKDKKVEATSNNTEANAPRGPAPDQVTPGIKNVKGEYDSPNRPNKPEPYSAHYDKYGRQIGRTDYTNQPDPKTHTNPHHHIRVYGPAYSGKGKEGGPFPGEHPLDKTKTD